MDMTQVHNGHSLFRRYVGWMFRRRIGESEVLILRSKQVHSLFVFISLGTIHLDRNGIVLHKQVLRPWRIGAYRHKAKYVVECHPNQLESVQIGASLKHLLVR